jgi:hypothetical protein
MTSAMRVRVIARLALMPAAALLVHQLRFMLAFGSGAGLELARQGHSYLHSLVPWAVLALALATGGFLSALGRALGGQRSLPRYTLSFAALWLLCSACLVGIYVVQELIEGAIIAGHPALLTGVFGDGGWWAVPAALCVGLVLAAVFHGARCVLELAVRYGTRRRPRTSHADAQHRPAGVVLRRSAPLVAGWSGRGPPG